LQKKGRFPGREAATQGFGFRLTPPGFADDC
jgi:hypothetical protein